MFFSMRMTTRILALGGTALALALTTLPHPAPAAEKGDTYELLNLFGEVFERVRSDYVEEPKDQDLVEAAINGMLTSLDPHSSYLNEKSYKEMEVQTEGKFGGLGIEVTMENGLVKVVSPIDDTPAYKAGIQAGDFITHIDGEQVMGMTLSEAVEKMRGPVGTKIKITVAREGENEPKDYTIVRDTIVIHSVRSHAEGDVGYLRITSFSQQTFSNLKDDLEKLKKDIPNMKGVVLDLRNNPGGLLDQAINVSDAFLEQGEIVSTRGRDPQNTKRYSAHAGDLLDGLPMVVLINGGSASASEIVSGALKDHKRAIVMGTKSFGKGSVQTVIPLEGHGAMRLTTSRYYTPSGHSIQAKGIEPDIIVEQAKVEPVKKTPFRSEAELRGRLKNEDELNADKEKEAQQEEQEEKKDNRPSQMKDKDKGKNKGDEDHDSAEDGDGKKIKASQDFQLQRALDLLRGLSVYKTSVN